MNPSEHLQAAQRAELECFTGMFDSALAGLDQLTRLHLQAVRELAQNTSQAMRDALQARDPREWAALPQQALRGDGTQAAAYVQQLGEIAGAMQAGFSQALRQSAEHLQQSLQAAAQATPGAGNGQTDWLRGSTEMLTQALQNWTHSQAQAARSLSEQMQRLAQDAGQAGAAPAPDAAAAARARPAARRRAS